MEYYIYQAEVYCRQCTLKIKHRLIRENGNKVPVDANDETSYDSGEYPKGPYDNEESDTPQHCGACHVFLEQPLTTHGVDYVREKHADRPSEVTRMWMRFYGLRP